MPSQVRFKKNSKGRESQKKRTRKALVAAATALIRDGRQPTVAEVAEAAEISRATASRYFPSQEMLLAEVALFDVGGPYFQTAKKSCPCPKRSVAWFGESESGPIPMSSRCARFSDFHLTQQPAFDGRAIGENGSRRLCRPCGAGLIQRLTTN